MRDVRCSTFPNAPFMLADLHEEVPGDRQERDVSLLDADVALLAPERDEEVRAGVRIDDRLQADLGLLSWRLGWLSTSLCPTMPSALPITEMFGLKTFPVCAVWRGCAALRASEDEKTEFCEKDEARCLRTPRSSFNEPPSET